MRELPFRFFGIPSMRSLSILSRCPSAEKLRRYFRSSSLAEPEMDPSNTASIDAREDALVPFHIQLCAPPARRAAAGRLGVFDGVAASLMKSIASMKLDFPDPLGPMITFSARMSTGASDSPKLMKLSSFSDFMNMPCSRLLATAATPRDVAGKIPIQALRDLMEQPPHRLLYGVAHRAKAHSARPRPSI